ncbi:LPXTG cell wall anchor domain-containing protein, partial [Thomasclavelia sp.]
VLNDSEAKAEEVTNAVNGLTKAMAGLVENNPVVDNNVDTPDTVKPGDTTVNAIKTGDNNAIGVAVALITLSLAGYYVTKKRLN